MCRTFLMLLAGVLMGLLAFGLPACGDDTGDGSDGGSGTDGSSGLDGSSGNDGGTDGGGGGADLPICDEVNVTGTRVAPNLLLVLDKSGSMADPISSTSWRTKMQDLQDAVDSLLTQGEGEIKFGLMAYPDCDNCTQYSCPCACTPGAIDQAIGSSVNNIRNAVNALPADGLETEQLLLENRAMRRQKKIDDRGRLTRILSEVVSPQSVIMDRNLD